MSTTLPLPLLQSVDVASPCSVRWEEMKGDDRARRCATCDRLVYNIAGYTEAEAELLLRTAFDDDGTTKKRLCAVLYRRADGTILTADCPVGLAAVRARTRRTIARVAAAIGLTALAAWAAARESSRFTFARTQPLTSITNYLRGEPVRRPMYLGSLERKSRFHSSPPASNPVPSSGATL